MAVINTYRALNTKQFHWDPDSKTFSEEASTVGFTGSCMLFDDACDVGIHLKSHRTGKIEPFYLSKTVKDSEGDIQAWEFASVKSNLGCKVVIFND